MGTERIDIAEFREVTSKGRVSLLATVKSFDLQAIRKRYLASKKNKSGKAGSVERRAPAEGGLVRLTVEDGKIVAEEILERFPEPRGLAIQGDWMAVSSEDRVNFIHRKTGERRSLSHPWFSYIHTVDFSADGQRVLVASSGLDCLFEFDLKTFELTWEWFAWENGFQEAHDPATGQAVWLTRKPAEAEAFKAAGKAHLLISDPREEYLPTAKRAAFINSVCYDTDDPDYVIATFFHEGAVFRIRKSDGSSERVLEGLKNPHGGCRYAGQFMATSTASGEVVRGNLQDQTRFELFRLKGKPTELGTSEWIQNTIRYGSGGMLCIDSNRNAFVRVENGEFECWDYNLDYAIQEVVVEKTE